MVLLDFNLELRKGSKSSMQVPLIAMLSTIKPDQNDGAILGVNIWLQLGWASPCEVTKNLVVSVAFSIGHGVLQSFRWLMSTHTGSPKPPKNINLPKNQN
jgi:hypothetical protein